MRKAAITSIAFVAISVAANAQFSISPRLALESNLTSIRYNQSGSFRPNDVQFAPQAGIRMDYRFKKQHGLFAGVATDRSVVNYRFTDIESGMKNFTADAGDYRFRIETGYQFSSKAINLKSSKGKTTQIANTSPSTKQKSSNGTYSRCGGYKSSAMKHKQPSLPYMKIQPYAGYSFVPGAPSNVISTEQNGTSVYEYRAGNWTQAAFAGVDLEFGKGAKRIMTIGVQYLKGFSNMGTETIVETGSNKTSMATVSSSNSQWSVTAGFPIQLGKKKQAVSKSVYNQQQYAKPMAPAQKGVQAKPQQKKSCTMYYRSSGCTRSKGNF